MAAFFWSNGPAMGSQQTMLLTIVGEVDKLQVISSGGGLYQPVPVQNFVRCIPTQTIVCGPVPLVFLPLTASGTGCVPAGQTVTLVPTATSASPTDPFTTGPNPFCDALTAGGIAFVTPEGGGFGTTPQERCDAAQKSPALGAARSAFDSACAHLRSDQSNVTAYVGAAAAAATIGGGLVAAAVMVPYPANVVLAVLAVIAFAVAIIFSILAVNAIHDVGVDEGLLEAAQRAWESAVAAVRAACCPAWITINTADLVCA
jgi:hypothetical protein